jgi:hypothetical protein
MTLTTGSLEERVGISQFLNKDNPGFRGTIKERGVPNTAEGVIEVVKMLTIFIRHCIQQCCGTGTI